jgi:putative membrane protein
MSWRLPSTNVSAPSKTAQPQTGHKEHRAIFNFPCRAALKAARTSLRLRRKIQGEGFSMDFATKDLAFAVGHHVLVFALAGIIAFELGVAKQGLAATDIRRLGKVDGWYGILAGLILMVGFARANFAAKGWDYYSHNHFFWAKIGAFALVGILSIWPTVAFIRWRSALKKDEAFRPTPAQIQTVRRFIWAEVFFFALIPIFAAAMARGYGTVS